MQLVSMLLGLGVVLLAAPSRLLSRKTVPFNVRVPPDKVDAPEILAQRRFYRIRVITSVVVIATASLMLTWVLGHSLVYAVSGIALLLVSVVFWYQAGRAIASAKQRDGWFRGRRQGAVVDTSFRTDPVPFPWLWLAPAVLVVAATIIAGVIQYPGLPDTLTIPKRVDGHLGGHDVATTVWSAFGLVFAQILETALIAFLTAGVLRARPDLDASRPEASARQYRRYLGLMTKGMLLMTAIMNVALLALSWLIWHDGQSDSAVLTAVGAPAAVSVAIIGFLAIRVGPAGTRLKAGELEEGTESDLVPRDDDRNWKGGLVYVNRDDPSILVPRRMGIGWTFNLAHPVTKIVLAVLILTTLVSFALRGFHFELH